MKREIGFWISWLLAVSAYIVRLATLPQIIHFTEKAGDDFLQAFAMVWLIIIVSVGGAFLILLLLYWLWHIGD